MFAHLPINHPLRPLYRFLAALTGLYVLLFGIVGLVQSGRHPLFARDHIVALGLRTNMAFSLLSILMGLLVVAAAIIGRNVDFRVFLFGGLVFLVSGMAMLVVMQTSLNLLNFTVATCVVSFLVGLVLVTAGLYGRSGTPEQHDAVEADRQRRATAPA
jgi:hypothetical protein